MAPFNVNDEIKRLSRLRVAEVYSEAGKAGLSKERIRAATTADELRRAILLKRCRTHGVGVKLG